MLQEVSARERIDNDLLRRYHQDGDLQARETLAERCTPLVRSIARRYVGRGQEMEDLLRAGMLGLAKAIERYEARPGGRFTSFAVPNIQGEIRRHFRDRTWAVHVPRSVQELDARVQRACSETLQQTGLEATRDDLARILDVSTDQVQDAQAAGRSYRALSLDQPALPDGTERQTRGDLDPGFEQVENLDVIDRAMDGLAARDQQVVQWRFRDGLLQREIAEKIEVSQMQVSRILRAALVRMSEADGGQVAA